MARLHVLISRVLLITVVVAFIALAASFNASADPYFNSAECATTGLNGSRVPVNPDHLHCDDVENANGFIQTCDSSGQPCCLNDAICSLDPEPNSGFSHPPNDGWSGYFALGSSSGPGTIGWPDAQGGSEGNFQRCGNKGAGGTDCTGTSGLFNNNCGDNPTFGIPQDRHPLYQIVTEDIYIRFYRRHASVLSHPGQNAKWLMPQTGGGSQGFGILKKGTGFLTITQKTSNSQGPDNRNHPQNQGNNAVFGTGMTNWWYFEWHIYLGTNNTYPNCDGFDEIWADDCGPRGDACPETPTLRSRHTGMCNTEMVKGIGTLWWESWGNPGDCGEENLDQILVSKSFVGPMNAIPTTTNKTFIGTTLSLYERIQLMFKTTGRAWADGW